MRKIKESYVETAPGEYVIYSASDLVDSNEHVPLVYIKTDTKGDLYAVATGNTPLDKESYQIAVSSLASSKKSNKSVKDTLIRLDKTLNHSDPFFSVENDRSRLGRVNIGGVGLLAAQALVTLRDDLKAVILNKSSDEADVANKYQELTGVNYYTDEIIDRPQYDAILTLLAKDTKDYANYIYPKDNKYIQSLKDLAENLIETVNTKNGELDIDILNSKLDSVKNSFLHKEKTKLFYKNYDKNMNKLLNDMTGILGPMSETAEDEEEIVDKFEQLTGVNYYTEKITDKDKYLKILDELFSKENKQVTQYGMHEESSEVDNESYELPSDSKFIQKLKDFTEDTIEKLLIRIEPDFYNK